MMNIKMDGKKIIVLLVLLGIIIIPSLYITGETPENEAGLIRINVDNVLSYVKKIVSFGPRISGYEASYEVASYLASELRGFGYNVTFESFNLTVPVDYGSELIVGNIKVKAYALLPNLIETCYTNGLKAPSIYIKSTYGDLRDFKGYNVTNKIVFLDFNSGEDWRWAAYLGAKGVVFIHDPNNPSTYRDNLFKRFWVPIDFPRIAIMKNDYEKIKKQIESGANATLVVHMMLEKRTAYNVIGYLPGTSIKDENILLATHYDTWSIIPLLSKGADDAVGAGILLETAKYIARGEHKRGVYIIFFAGHYQGLAGSREFLYKHLNDTLLDNIGLVLEIEGSAYSKDIGIYSRGNFHGYYPITYQEELTPVSNFMVSALNKTLGTKLALWPPNDDPLQNPVDRPKYFDFEPFSAQNIRGLAIATQNPSIYRNTPFDTYNRLVEIESKVHGIYISGSAYLTSAYNVINRYTGSLRGTYNSGLYRILYGRVLEYNERIGNYVPVPNSTVVIYGTAVGARTNPALFVVRHYIIAKTDSKGYYEVHGLIRSNEMMYTVLGFNDYPSQGPIKYGPDFGMYSIDTYRVRLYALKTPADVSVFRCGGIVMFDILDPNTASPITGMIPVEIFDRKTQNFARFFGFISEMVGFLPSREMSTGVLMIFANPTMAHTPRYDIVIPLGGTRWYSAIFNNNSRGFTLGPNKQVIISFTIREEYLGFRSVNRKRLESAIHSHLYTEPIEKLENEALSECNLAESYFRNGDYYNARGKYILAWMLERNAYINLRYSVFDAAYSSVFFLLLALPFAYLLEKFVFETSNIRKEMSAFALIFSFTIAFMIFEHPGFTLIKSVPLVAIGFLMLILTLLPLIIITDHAYGAIKRLRKRFIGKHFAEMDKLSAIVLAASLGIRNLRRRWIRTVLLIVSIAIATMAFVSIVSVASAIYVAPIGSYEIKNGYTGILIRESSFRALPPMMASQIKTMLGNKIKDITEIVYYYPYSMTGKVIARRPNGEPITISGILGINPEDFKYIPGVSNSKLYKFIFTPGSRPFISSSERAVIVPLNLVNALRESGYNVSLGSVLPGLNLKVVGIINNTSLYEKVAIDIDKKAVLPFAREQEAAGGRVHPIAERPMSASEVVIVPSKIAKDLGGEVYAIRIIPKNPNNTKEIATKIAEIFNYMIYYSVKVPGGYKVVEISRVRASNVSGTEIIIPGLILALTILGSIIGAVYERKGEIGILSAVGLSPLHVAGMFLMEFTLIAVVSSFFGYMAGITAPKLISGLKMNAGSMWIVYSILISMFITILATLYPVRYASRLVTPSFERKWRLEAHAIRRGDIYYVKIPFVIHKEEVKGAMLYIKEYLDQYKSEDFGPFTIDKVRFREEIVENVSHRIFETRIRVKPFDWGVVMKGKLNITTTGNTSIWELVFERASGAEHVWIRGIRQFTDVVRKQLLLWRGLTPEERRDYIKRAQERKDIGDA